MYRIQHWYGFISVLRHVTVFIPVSMSSVGIITSTSSELVIEHESVNHCCELASAYIVFPRTPFVLIFLLINSITNRKVHSNRCPPGTHHQVQPILFRLFYHAYIILASAWSAPPISQQQQQPRNNNKSLSEPCQK